MVINYGADEDAARAAVAEVESAGGQAISVRGDVADEKDMGAVGQQAARRVRPGGAIVFFSSSVIGRVLPGYTVYAGSKGAVEAATFILI